MRHPPYHLRTNKAVDRLLLVDVLRKMDFYCSDFTYYSLAGPFLEDLRIMDHFFPDMRLVSLEADEQTFKRQQFNQFSSRIELRRATLADFLSSYQPGKQDAFWLDYTDLKYTRLVEFQRVLKLAPPNSVVRITLRAEPELDLAFLENTLTTAELERVHKELRENFMREFDQLIAIDAVQDDAFLKFSRFPQMVQFMIRRAASLALDTPGCEFDFLPVQSTRYNDNTQMLSVTGVVYLRDQKQIMQERLKSVRLANFDWHEPDRIDIPALSIKERLHLERYLPVPGDQDAGEVLFQALDYLIDRSESRTKRQLAHYADCHRDYPNFVRISI